MGIFWNLASLVFLFAVLPFEPLIVFKQIFVLIASALAACALFEEWWNTVRPD